MASVHPGFSLNGIASLDNIFSNVLVDTDREIKLEFFFGLCEINKYPWKKPLSSPGLYVIEGARCVELDGKMESSQPPSQTINCPLLSLATT